jgi:dihydrofolate reductase
LKTIHYVTLTADGYVVEADAAAGVPPAILQHLMGLVAACGDIVVGRRTYEVLLAQTPMAAIPGTVIVLSRTLGAAQDVTIVRSPAEALRVLADRGLTSALIGGGPATYGAFLDYGAIDELHLNVAPVLAGSGLRIASLQAQPVGFDLVSVDRLEGGVIQAHYRRPS